MAQDTSTVPMFTPEDFRDPTAARPNRILARIYEELDRASTPLDLSDILARLAALESAPVGGGGSAEIPSTVIQIAYDD